MKGSDLSASLVRKTEKKKSFCVGEEHTRAQTAVGQIPLEGGFAQYIIRQIINSSFPAVPFHFLFVQIFMLVR